MLTAVLVPGGGYTTQAPLLYLANEALSDRGARCQHITWTVPAELWRADAQPFVRAHVAAALAEAEKATPGARPVVIAKSLGSFAAALVAERALPAIWLTPILAGHDHAAGIARAITASTQPALLIGGGADELWSREAAVATGKQVHHIDAADHSLRVPGALGAFTDVLGKVAAAIEDFLDQLAKQD